MTWDENLLQFQKKYGGSLLGSIYPYQPAGLLHTRFRGAELTFYPSMVSSGNAPPLCGPRPLCRRSWSGPSPCLSSTAIS